MDNFVKSVAIVTVTLLTVIFISTYIGVNFLGSKFEGIDDVVERIAVEEHKHIKNPHPVMELPGDAEVGAFTVASLGVGMIIGFLWRKLFYENAQ